MRINGLLDALLPRVRQQILAALLLHPDRSWYLSDLAKHLRMRVSSLQRELASLTDAGILVKTRDGNRNYYQADRDCPVLSDLQGLLVKTAGLADQVRAALTEYQDKIRLAFIYGSIASGSARSGSDVDLFIIGSVDLADLAKDLKPLEERLLRAVNPTLYSEHDLRDKAASGHHFVTRVLAGPKLFIIGSEDDLATIATGGAGETAPDIASGTG